MTAPQPRPHGAPESRPPDLAALYDAHAEAICRTIHALTGSRQLAEDAVQDTFVFAHQRLAELADGPGMRSWLFSVALNRMRHDVRATGRYRKYLDRFGDEPHGEVALPDAETRRRENAERIQSCILEIPLAYREVFVLFELEGHPGKDIADALGIEVATVFSRLSKARSAFRGAWTARGSDE